MASLAKIRRAAWRRQGGRCCYCRRFTWEKELAAFAAEHGISELEASLRQSTAEHLVARQDGGTDEPNNIASACLECNRGRHRVPHPLDSTSYRRWVRSGNRARQQRPAASASL